MLIAIIRLLRLPNLLVVAITQWLIADRVLGQAYAQENIVPVLSQTELGLLLLATVLVTAMGYVVNDLIDEPIDRVNRPDRLIVGNWVSRRGAMILVVILGTAGFFVSWYLAWQKSEESWLWLYPVFAGLLLAYPKYLKQHYFAGNLFVAVACAGTAGLIWLAERSAWRQLTAEFSKQTAALIVLFMVYAFISTWIREIVKDLEDQEGDLIGGRLSLPLYWGEQKAKFVVLGLSIFLIFALAILPFLSVYEALIGIGKALVPILIALVLLLSWLLTKAKEQTAYYWLSQYWKFFLLGGLCLLLCYQLP